MFSGWLFMRYPSFCKDTMNILISQEKWGDFQFYRSFTCEYLSLFVSFLYKTKMISLAQGN